MQRWLCCCLLISYLKKHEMMVLALLKVLLNFIILKQVEAHGPPESDGPSTATFVCSLKQKGCSMNVKPIRQPYQSGSLPRVGIGWEGK